jgi:hypothetical protein
VERLSYLQQFYNHWRNYGLPDWRIQELYNEKMTKIAKDKAESVKAMTQQPRQRIVSWQTKT